MDLFFSINRTLFFCYHYIALRFVNKELFIIDEFDYSGTGTQLVFPEFPV